MSLTKKKISVSAIIAALSFLYLAICPVFLNPIYGLILENPFGIILRNLISYIFSFGNILNFLACLFIVIGIFTKVDKIAVTVTAAIFWLSSLIGLITNIANSIKYEYYTLTFAAVINSLSYMFAYFLLFAIALWLTILFFTKKETPKFLKLLVFLPIVVLAIIHLFSFFSNASGIISVLSAHANGKWVIYSLFSNLASIFNRLIAFIGFTAVAVKLANLKKKPKNTVEISEEITIEKVVAD